MSKLHILGSCSGTEPFPGCHHTSLVLEHQDVLYWFDAGECCSYTAHLMGGESDNPRLWSYRITANGKKIIFSGDVDSVGELSVWMDDCDLLIMETGHHKASEICARLKSQYPGVKDVIFLHHGRELLNDRTGALQRAETAWGDSVKIASDAMTIEL